MKNQEKLIKIVLSDTDCEMLFELCGKNDVNVRTIFQDMKTKCITIICQDGRNAIKKQQLKMVLHGRKSYG